MLAHMSLKAIAGPLCMRKSIFHKKLPTTDITIIACSSKFSTSKFIAVEWKR